MSAKKPEATDIIISGGGSAGLTLALLLGGIGARVAVIEPHPPAKLKDTKPEGRTSALMKGSLNILAATDAWQDCEAFGGAMDTLRIIDDSGREQVSIDFRAGEIKQDIFGINIPNNILRAALTDRLRGSENIKFLESRSIAALAADDHGITATLDDGAQLRARLLVGADGRNSPTRDLSGIACWTRDYGQSAITCLIDHTLPHESTSTEFHRPSGPFTLVPLPGNRSSVVWVDYTERADTFMRMSKQDFEAALQDRTKGVLGAVSLASPPSSFPLAALKAKSLTAKRVALIAEAAHILHPMGAQGLNLSLRDTAALAEVIADALRLGCDPGAKTILDRYENRRRHDIATRLAGTDGLNRIVSNNVGAARSLRRLGLKTLDNVVFLKELAMAQGLAPQNDDARLAQGKAL